MYFALMYKTLGGYKWTDLYRSSPVMPDDECAVNDFHPPVTNTIDDTDNILTTAKMSLKGLKAVCTKCILFDSKMNSFFC